MVLVSEGATFTGRRRWSSRTRRPTCSATRSWAASATGCRGCCGTLSPKYNNGRRINVINQRLGYLVRGGDPDALDSIVPMAFGNLALDLILEGVSGRLVCVRNGRYDHVPIDVVTSRKKVVDVGKFYDTEPAAAPLQALRRLAGLHHDQ